MVWRTNKPIEADRVKNLGKVIRDNKAAFDTAVQKCFYWSDSETSAGIVTSSATTGTARAFYAAESALSTENISVNTSGRLYLVSESPNRLYVLGTSTATTLVGSRSGIVCNHDVGKESAALATDKMILVQAGVKAGIAAGAHAISYATTYTATPNLMVTMLLAGRDGAEGMYTYYVSAQATTGFTVTTKWASGEVEGSDEGGFYWRAEGEVSA